MKRVRGMPAFLGAAAVIRSAIVSAFQTTTRVHGFLPIETPLAEHSRVFTRSLGPNSDIVSKEMFAVSRASSPSPSSSGKEEDSVVLRPEGTAGVVNALVGAKALSNPSLAQSAVRVAYAGPMFRYERPQRGRERQFTQLGVEALGGSVGSGGVDAVDTVASGVAFLGSLGLAPGADYVLAINTLGGSGCQRRYGEVLRAHFEDARGRGELSEDSEARLERNAVLRILDSKHPDDAAAVSSAPCLLDTPGVLSEGAQTRFGNLRRGLDDAGIPYQIEPRLVRGLDYYSDAVFEAVGTSPALGASQATLLAGGRYSGLASAMGNKKDVPGIGWAAGMERLALALSDRVEGDAPFVQSALAAARPIAILPSSPTDVPAATALLTRLRSHPGIQQLGAPLITDSSPSKSLSKSLRRADQASARLAVIVGADIVVRNLDTGSQLNVVAPLDLDLLCTHIIDPLES